MNEVGKIRAGKGMLPYILSKDEPSDKFGKGGGIWLRPVRGYHPIYIIYIFTGGNSILKAGFMIPYDVPNATGMAFSTVLDIIIPAKKKSVLLTKKWAPIGFMDISSVGALKL